MSFSLSGNRTGGNASAPNTTAAPISGKWRFSTGVENRYSSETPSVKGGFSVNEWLPAICCKLFISNMFLFE